MLLPQAGGGNIKKSRGKNTGQEPCFLLPRRDKGKKMGKGSQESSYSNNLIISQLACAMLK